MLIIYIVNLINILVISEFYVCLLLCKKECDLIKRDYFQCIQKEQSFYIVKERERYWKSDTSVVVLIIKKRKHDKGNLWKDEKRVK